MKHTSLESAMFLAQPRWKKQRPLSIHEARVEAVLTTCRSFSSHDRPNVSFLGLVSSFGCDNRASLYEKLQESSGDNARMLASEVISIATIGWIHRLDSPAIIPKGELDEG